MRFARLMSFILLAFLLGASFAQTKPGPGFSTDNIDKSVDPCVDFYQYACGNWMKNSEIPADQSSWASFIELDERNLVTLHDILDKASAKDPGRNAVTQK